MKRKLLGAVLIVAAFLCTGCAKVPDMTAEENNAVAEYAASVLISRSYSYKARYVDDLEPVTEPATEAETETEAQTPAIVPIESSGEENETKPEFNIAGDMGLDSVEVMYESYKIVDEYPDDPDAVFSFRPQDGCSFIVVSLRIHNLSAETVVLNNTDRDNIVKLTIGKRRCSNYANLLSNDITRLNNVSIEPDGNFESVVVFMVDNDILEDMEEFELSVSGGEKLVVKK